MPKRSDAAEYVAPAIEVLPKPTCNMSSRPSLSTSCASLPGWTVRRWPRLVVPTSQPYNSRPDEFATSVNIAVTRAPQRAIKVKAFGRGQDAASLLEDADFVESGR